MNASRLRLALAFSLLVNLGVLGVAAYRALAVPGPDGFAGLPHHLQLSAEQQRSWHEAEAAFLAQLGTAAVDIRAHRDRMVNAIFVATPDLAAIDAERAAIARLQDEQQKLVIRQLLRERELLNTEQRARLARLLLEQPVGPTTIERLHRD